MRAVVIAVALLALTACSSTRAIHGSFEDGEEIITGTSFPSGDRSGTMSFQSSKGLSCEGRWSYVTEFYGRGIFHCNNGKGGPFEFNGRGTSGSGTGRMGDRRIIFQYG